MLHTLRSFSISQKRSQLCEDRPSSALRPNDGLSCAELSQLHKHFPDAFTGEEPEEGGGGPFNSNFYRLSVRNIANPFIRIS
jgi:hypothetical protein